jgi:hypothetical protein
MRSSLQSVTGVTDKFSETSSDQLTTTYPHISTNHHYDYHNALPPIVHVTMETNVFFQLSSGDGLPSQVCQHCAQQVNTSYDFKLRCENTDATLRQYLSKMQPNHRAGTQVCFLWRFWILLHYLMTIKHTTIDVCDAMNWVSVLYCSIPVSWNVVLLIYIFLLSLFIHLTYQFITWNYTFQS